MVQMTLAKLLTRDKEVALCVTALLDSMHGCVAIRDANRTLLAGFDGDSQEEFPVLLNDDVMGWVGGDEQARLMVSVLTYMVNREAEKRSLARDALDKYRELNLLYELSEKIGASLQVRTVATIAVNESRRRIKDGTGFILMLDEVTGVLVSIISPEEGFPLSTGIRPGEGIIGQVVLSGQAEVVDDVNSDPRRIAPERTLRSLVCAPLKVRQRVIGVLGVGSEEPIFYTAADLKFLGMIASQVAPAIDNAMLYERTVKDAQQREEQLQQQLSELRIEVDQVRQSRQVAAITGTDYFKALRQQASDLRKDLYPFE